MNVKSIFSKAIVLCAILLLSSCQSKEEKVIGRINDLTEQIKAKGDDLGMKDWMYVMDEFAQIQEEMEKCKFSKEQFQELLEAQTNIYAVIASTGVNSFVAELEEKYDDDELTEEMEDYFEALDDFLDIYLDDFAEDIDKLAKEFAKDLEELAEEVAEDVEEIAEEISEGNVIGRINDLTKQIEKKGEDLGVKGWKHVMDELPQIQEEMVKTKFSDKQLQELLKAQKNLYAAIGSTGVKRYVAELNKKYYDDELSEEMEDFTDDLEDFVDIFLDDFAEDVEDLVEGYFDDDCEDEVAIVYSNMYDGYLNVRAEPSTKSQVLGTLRNGPEGAELLSAEGKWTKVRVDGIEGYVWSAYLQSVPSEPVYISASAVVGEWSWCDENAHMDSYTIKSDGKFYQSGYLSMEEEGTWYLSGHNIILKYSDGRTIACNVTGNTIIVNDYEYERM